MGCQLFNNRKCGKKKKCLQTQEDAWQEKTGAKPKQDFSSLKLGNRRENDTCEEAAAGVGGRCKPGHPRTKSADGKGEGHTSTTKGNDSMSFHIDGSPSEEMLVLH